MEKKIIIAIDGFSSCGKSTLAKAMAIALEYVFVDTGAMYRAIALYFLRKEVSFTNEKAVEAALAHIELRFKYNSISQKSDMYLNGENVEQEIRSMLVSQKVSEVASNPAVRAFAVAQQQAMGKDKGIVMDGRDIGTVVFPNAALKLFVTADPEVRIERRYQELLQTNPSIGREEVAANLQQRDLMDSTRAHSPLRQAEDAMVLDNTNLNREAQFQLAMQWVKEKMSAS